MPKCDHCGKKGIYFKDLKTRPSGWECVDVRACIEREVKNLEKEQKNEYQRQDV